MLGHNLITSSLLLIFLLLITYFTVGVLFKTTIKKIIRRDVHFSIFKTILYGLLIVVYFYTLLKSPFLLNSVSITCIPALLFFYERSKSVNFKSQSVKYRNLTNYFLFGLLAFFVFYLAKYLFHFSNQINTGYSDQAFYHTIASSLKYTGIETINIHTGALKLIPGMIYHYWDLWFLAFHYDLLSFLNHFGLFESFNQFEINTLVFQPSLFLILFVGFIEVAFKIFKVYFKIVKSCTVKVVITAFLVLIHSFLEFGVIHHPKQFFIAAIFVLFILEILEKKNLEFHFFYFYPVLLFYYPLPGSILIATCFIFSIKWVNILSNFRETKFFLHLISVIFSVFLFLCYYFFYAQTCLPQLYTQNMPDWSLPSVINRIFIYHGYHTMISPTGFFVLLNFVLLLLIYKKRILSNIISVKIFKSVIIFSILNIFVGHFSSALLYNVPEEFQFYNNDYFSLSILILCDLSLIFYYVDTKVFLTFSICILGIIYFLASSFFHKPEFYNGVSISYKNYFLLKSKIYQRNFNPQIKDDLPVFFSNSDIILSIFNSFPLHRKDMCSEK